jgi:hypothetical protein
MMGTRMDMGNGYNMNMRRTQGGHEESHSMDMRMDMRISTRMDTRWKRGGNEVETRWKRG